MTPEREAQMREAFEANYGKREGFNPKYLIRNSFGTYNNYAVENAWQEWLACARALEPKWQPIETAPKDGTRVLLWATRGSLLYPTQEQIVGRFSRGWWGADHVLSHVTHWMPLPEQPKAAMSAALEDGNATE